MFKVSIRQMGGITKKSLLLRLWTVLWLNKQTLELRW
jgi:hypothetical protein